MLSNPPWLVDKVQKNFVRIDYWRLRHELRRACHLVLKFDVVAALHIVDRLECRLADWPAHETHCLRADLGFVRAMSSALQDDCEGAVRAARVMLQRESASPARRAYAAAVCHFSHWRLRDFDGMYSLEVPRPQMPYRRRHVIPVVVTRCIEAAIELEQLRLTTAKRLALDALDMAESLCGPHAAITALPATLVAQVLYEQGCLSAAHAMIRNRLASINSSGILDCTLRAYSVLAGIAMHGGQEGEALALLLEAELLGLERGWQRLVAATLFERVRILLRADRVDEARSCAQRLEKMTPRPTCRSVGGEFDVEYYRHRAQVQLAAACFPTAAAVDHSRQLHRRAIENQDHYAAMEVAVQLAVCLDGLGEAQEADCLFQRSLDLGRFAGLYQVFVDGGKRIQPMLARAYDQARQPGAVNRALLPYIESVRARVGGRTSSCRSGRAALRTSNGLSSRESDILELVARGMSNKRIALALTIAPETVKSHVKRIFIKLDVKTRAEAVSRANALRLSPPSGGFAQSRAPLRIEGDSYRRRDEGAQ